MKYEKYIVGVLYFVVCSAKTLLKYFRNVKYDMGITGLRQCVLNQTTVQRKWKMRCCLSTFAACNSRDGFVLLMEVKLSSTKLR